MKHTHWVMVFYDAIELQSGRFKNNVEFLSYPDFGSYD